MILTCTRSDLTSGYELYDFFNEIIDDEFNLNLNNVNLVLNSVQLLMVNVYLVPHNADDC